MKHDTGERIINLKIQSLVKENPMCNLKPIFEEYKIDVVKIHIDGNEMVYSLTFWKGQDFLLFILNLVVAYSNKGEISAN